MSKYKDNLVTGKTVKDLVEKDYNEKTAYIPREDWDDEYWEDRLNYKSYMKLFIPKKLIKNLGLEKEGSYWVFSEDGQNLLDDYSDIRLIGYYSRQGQDPE